jgi:dihydroorotate dehydrogenase
MEIMIKPWLWVRPSISHQMAPFALPWIARFCKQPESTYEWNPFVFHNLKFRNRVGIAGGVDKEGNQLLSWQNLGAGFLEVGTITPRPQSANPGCIMDRDLKTMSLWNKMGFPNQGAEALKKFLTPIRDQIKIPLFINIGKNRDTPNENATEDYLKCVRELSSLADGFVVNISSPNTQGLRDLQDKKFLKELLTNVRATVPAHQTLLVKLSPDMAKEQLCQSLDIALESGVNGFVLTNTTTSRTKELPYPSEGGVSGLPITQLSRSALETCNQHLTEKLGSNKKNVIIISAGGILSVNEIQYRLNMGADLVQVYSALVYEGPLFFSKVAKSYDIKARKG